MSENDEIKICRWCHKVYSSPFCGNGCERRDFFKKDKIEPRELRLKPNKQGKIRWVCLSCKNEFTQKELEKHDFVCPNCGQKNDFYPFTKKECAICKEDGKARKLPLWAKACEKCGKNEFIIN